MIDPIDELLTPRPEPPAPTGDRVWVATRAAVARRRWLRRAGVGLAFAACFAAGMATSGLFLPRPRPAEPAPVPRPTEEAPPPSSPSPGDPYANEPPERIEKWARLREDATRRELYRRAGDGYLARGDELAALRCYRRALDGSPAEELAVRVDDTWLMMSLKRARNPE